MGLERLVRKIISGKLQLLCTGGKIRGISSVERRDQAVPLFRSRTMRPVHPASCRSPPTTPLPAKSMEGRSFMSRRLPREVAHSVQLDRRER